MSLRRVTLLSVAVACTSAALILLAQIGLPARAEYTGYVTSNGERFAPEINAYAPPFELQELDGMLLSIQSLRGFPVLINFWATWCEPCKIEMPSLQAIYNTYKDRGLKIVAVNLGDPPEAARKWVKQMQLEFDVVMDSTGAVSSLYQLRGQPSTYVVSPGGTIAQIFFGPTTEAVLDAALAPYFSKGYTE